MIIPNWSTKTILVVEDDEISLEFLKELLNPSNAQIIYARNGQEAIEVFTSNPQIDLVLMDVQLPVLSGKEAMLQIKKQKKELPVVAQTAFAMSGDEEKYLSIGFDDYISKPIILEVLIEKISKYL